MNIQTHIQRMILLGPFQKSAGGEIFLAGNFPNIPDPSGDLDFAGSDEDLKPDDEDFLPAVPDPATP